ncbi:hypothetical protein CJF32_00000790 [Rutstroemia sp. NJR-2017a WRK4]|nr:hypothetical protein CJF32_00000790 [Rutstroemia sp. NJR-2017a WRK4]
MEISLFAPKLHRPKHKRILTEDESSSEDGSEMSVRNSGVREVGDDLWSRSPETSHSNAYELHCAKVAMALRHGSALAGTINTYHHATHCPATLEEVLQ